MADQKITQLTADTTPTSDDLVVTVNDPTGTPANRKVTLGNLPLGLGTSWTAWTPSWTNATVGNGTVDAKYNQIGKLISYRVALTFGSTTSFSGNVSVNIPVTAVGYTQFAVIGVGSCNDSGNTVYNLSHSLSSTTVGALFFHGTVSYGFVTATVPFTWGTGDILFIQGQYEAA